MIRIFTVTTVSLMLMCASQTDVDVSAGGEPAQSQGGYYGNGEYDIDPGFNPCLMTQPVELLSGQFVDVPVECHVLEDPDPGELRSIKEKEEQVSNPSPDDVEQHEFNTY